MSFIVRNPNAVAFILADDDLYYEFAASETGVDLEEIFQWEKLYGSSIGSGALLAAINAGTLIRRDTTNTIDIAAANAFDDAIWRWHLTHNEKDALVGTEGLPSSTNPYVSSLDNRFYTQNIVHVKLNPGIGEFDAIQPAIDSITTASVSNPWRVDIGPGVYSSADSITLKPYIWIQGSGDFDTVIEITDPSKSVIIGADFSALTCCLVTGSTDSGVCAIYYASTTGTDQSYFTVESVRFGNNDTHMISDATTAPSPVFCNNIKFGSTYQFNNGFIARAGGRVLVRNSTTNGVTAPLPGDLFFATGSTSQIVLTSVQVRSTNLASGNAIRLNNGARFRGLGVNVRNFARGLYVENAGSAPSISVEGINFEVCTQDIVIDHPATTGSLIGSADATKITINPTAQVSVVHLNTETGNPGVVFLGSYFQGYDYSKRIDLNKLTVQGATLGLYTGGNLGNAGGLNISVAAGEGFVRDGTGTVRQYSWTGGTTAIPANSSRYVTVNNLGSLALVSSITNLTDVIVLGRVVTTAASIDFIEKSYFDIQHFGDRVESNLRSILGPIFGSGSTVTESGTRQLSVTAGRFAYGTRTYTPAGGSPITFTAHYRDGVGGWTRVPAQTTVDNALYDDGTGTLATIVALDYAKHALYLVGDGADEKYLLVYAQDTYNALAAVETAALPIPPSWFIDAVTPIASLIVRGGSTNIIEIKDERPRIGFTSSGVSATADHGSLLGLADDDHPQYLLVDGTRPMSGSLDMGTNNIVNVGTIDGVDVELHGSRHNPNGVDPLTTAAPAANLTAITTNAAGIANSYSRSDHSHAISTAAAAQQLPDQTNAAGTSTSLARADHVHNIPTAIAVTIDANAVNAQGTANSFSRSDHTHLSPSGPAITQTPDQTNATGTSANYSRADHVHNIPTATPTTALSATTINAQGAAATFARSDHSHAILTGAPSSQTPESGNVTGTSANLARADHLHNIPTDVAVTLTPDAGNAKGVSTSFARADHVHNIATAAAVTLSATTTNTQGSSSSFSRADHTHALSTGPASTQTPDQSNATGTSANLARADHVHNLPAGTAVTLTPDLANAQGSAASFARADHVHNVPTAVAVAVGTANAQGSSSSFARADHVHEGVHGIRANIDDYNFGDVTLQDGTGISIVDNGSGVLTISAPAALFNTIFYVTYPGTGLTVNYTGGNIRVNDTFVSVASGSLLLTASESGEIYVDAAGTVAATTGSATTPANFYPIATYTTNATVVTLVSDRRVWVNQNIVWGLTSDLIAIQPDDTANAGTSARYARADHRHAVTATAPTTSLSATTANAEGTANSFARGDHTHAILTGVVSSQTPDQTNAAGTSANLARADHVHNIPTATAVGLDAASTSTQGAAASFARADHTHAIATGVVSTQLADQTNAAGTSPNFARADHIHNIPTAVAVSIGAANATGASTSFARADHVHQGVHGVQANAGALRFNNLTLQNGAGVTVTDNGSGVFTFDAATLALTELYATYPGTGLSVNYTAGKVRFNGAFSSVAASSILLTASSTGDIYVDTDGVVKSGTATPDSVIFAAYTTSGSAVTILEDRRTWINQNDTWGIAGQITTVQPNDTALAGTANSAARADHRHAISVAAPTTNLSASTANAAGAASTFARSDHSHAISTGAASSQTPDQSNAAGTSANLARADHVHNIPTATAVGLDASSVSAQGAASTFARSDHTHEIATGVVGDITTILPDATASAGSLNSFARADHRHAIDAAAPTTSLSASTANAEGTGTSFSRNDHSHAILTGVVSGQTPDQTNAAGTSANLARADHVHNIPTGTAVGLNAASTNTQGAAATFARADHTHAISVGITADITTILPDATASAGTSNAFARADHRHAIDAAAAISQTADTANAEGTSSSFARADHVHNIATAAPTTSLSASTSNAQGAASTFAKSDHSHAILTGTVSTQGPDQTNAAGTSANLARADHVHNIPTAVAVDIGTANAQGSSTTSFARADHVHRGIRSLAVNSGTARFGNINLRSGSGVSVSDDGAGNFTFDATSGGSELVVTNGGGLVANYTGGRVWFNNTFSTVASGNVTVLANQTNAFIYLDTDAVVKSGTSVPPYAIPMAQFTSGASTITALSEGREQVNHSLVYGVAGDISTILPNASAAAGTTGKFADAGHVHAIAVAAAASQTPDQANAAGASTSFARADHVHNIATAAPTTSLSATTTNAQGAASTFARSDHSHAILTGVVSAQTADQTNAAGTSANLARADHVHNIATAAPVTIGTANAQGTASTFAKSDHVHAHGAQTDGTLHAVVTTSVNGFMSASDKTKLDAVVYGLTADVTTILPDDAANAGTSTRYARADHRHAIDAAAAVAQTADVANAEGVSTSFARADHVHNIATAAPTTNLSATTSNAQGSASTFAKSDHSHAITTGAAIAQTPDQTNATGTSASLARADHVHNIATAAAVGLDATSTNTQGAATTFARSNHTHALATGVVSTQTPDQTNATGTSANLARADHVHNIPTAAAVGLNAASTNTQGSAATFARADHTHAISTGVVGDITTIQPDAAAAAGALNSFARADHRHAIVADPAVTQTPDQTNAEGTSTSFARADHVHNIPTAAAVSIASANAQGAASTFARSDHTHQGVHSIVLSGGTQRFNDITLVAGDNAFISDASGTYTFSGNTGSGTVSTTDATTTSVATFTTASNVAYLIKAWFVGRRTGGSAGTANDSATYERTCRVINNAGTLTLFTLQSDFTSESQLLWDSTIDVSGTTIRFRVTGATNNNVNWKCNYNVYSV